MVLRVKTSHLQSNPSSFEGSTSSDAEDLYLTRSTFRKTTACWRSNYLSCRLFLPASWRCCSSPPLPFNSYTRSQQNWKLFTGFMTVYNLFKFKMKGEELNGDTKLQNRQSCKCMCSCTQLHGTYTSRTCAPSRVQPWAPLPLPAIAVQQTNTSGAGQLQWSSSSRS